MQCEALEKVINIAQKNPKILLSPSFFEKLCARLEIDVRQTNDKMDFNFENRHAQVVIINPENCQQFKCIVQEGKNGVRIFEFINVLVTLLTDEPIPPSPHEKMGPTAEFYCERGIDILSQILPPQV
jgi:hypothetical protein